MKTVFTALWSALKATLSGVWYAISSIWSATTWPARWATAKAKASRFGLWLWSLKIDPPEMPVLRLFWIVPAVMLIGAAADRKWVRGPVSKGDINLEARLQSLGQMNIACQAEKNAWQTRAMAAETRYEELVKREPPSPGSPAALERSAAPKPAAKPAPRRKAAPSPSVLFFPPH